VVIFVDIGDDNCKPPCVEINYFEDDEELIDGYLPNAKFNTSIDFSFSI
jgi:hypothetical protein